MEALLALDGVEGRTGEAPHKLPARTKAYLLRVSGVLAMAHGDHDRAVTLYKEAISAYREMGHEKRAEYDRTVAAARGALTEAAFEAARASGHALSLEDAITQTLSNGE
jgi:hypothetical protein